MKNPVQEALDVKLGQLKSLSGLGAELGVVWLPSKKGILSGEVKSDTIYIYEKQEQRALETLCHEFLDYCIARAIEPYKKVTNKLISLINEEAYKEKEQIVEAIIRLLKTRERE